MRLFQLSQSCSYLLMRLLCETEHKFKINYISRDETLNVLLRVSPLFE